MINATDINYYTSTNISGSWSCTSLTGRCKLIYFANFAHGGEYPKRCKLITINVSINTNTNTNTNNNDDHINNNKT